MKNNYKLFTISLLLVSFFFNNLSAQNIRKINDKHISNQQERMVFKQWDKNKFTPTKGFLGLNYQYWLTWGLHPNYPKVDHRPLSPSGPQTIRLALVLAMRESTQKYKLHSDTLSTTALTELSNYTATLSTLDPLWRLYYKIEFADLAEQDKEINPLQHLSANLRKNLISKGVLKWYMEEHQSLRQRLLIAHNTNIDRGSRILTYHRLLLEYRTLKNNWNAKVENETRYIEISKKLLHTSSSIRLNPPQIPQAMTDVQIAQKILMRIYNQ